MLHVKKAFFAMKMSQASRDQEIRREHNQIPLDLAAINRTPGSIGDIVLRAKDEIFIPKFDAQVKISGAVLIATQVPYHENSSLQDYITEAGGFSGNVWRKKRIGYICQLQGCYYNAFFVL